MFRINKKNLLSLVGLGVLAPVLTGCDPAPSVALRVDCGDLNNQGAEVRVNGEFKGECPVDVMVVPGMTSIEARKNLEDLSYHYGKDEQQLVADTMKRVNLNLKREYPQEYYYKRATGIVGINEYLAKFPESNQAVELRQKLENIFYQNAGDINGAQAYLLNYPSGKYATEIKQKLAQLIEEKRVADEEAKIIAEENKRKAIADAGFIDNKDGTVTDMVTKLIWQRCSVGQNWDGSTCSGEPGFYNWYSARTLAKDGWRLPTHVELSSIVFCSSGQRDASFSRPSRNAGCIGAYQRPTILDFVFPKSTSTFFWAEGAFSVDFGTGGAWAANAYRTSNARLVRDGK